MQRYPVRGFTATESYLAVGTDNYGIMLLDRDTFEVAGSMYDDSSTWFFDSSLPPDDVNWSGGLAHITGDEIAASGDNVFQPILRLDASQPGTPDPVAASYGEYGSGSLGFDDYPADDILIGADASGEIYAISLLGSRIYRMVAGETAVQWPRLSDGAIVEPRDIAANAAGEFFVADGTLLRVVRMDPDGSRTALTDIRSSAYPRGLAANSSNIVL
jgi:hypothetical protein